MSPEYVRLSKAHQLFYDLICGFSIGIEFVDSDDLNEGDLFAMFVDLGILRITYVISQV